MRNLKKFLALVLAMMMCFSLMVTANAATGSFDDSESVTKEFQEAVEVLAGMGVLKGDDGKFMPTTTLDRAQAAAIMYRIVTGDAKDEKVGLYKYYGDFTDVPTDAWYAGYVGYCANAGIIKGDGAGHFNPNDKVTGYEMLVMLLRAVGYTNLSVFSGSDWRMQVASGAYQLGILKNVNATRYNGTLLEAAPREVVADVAFQAIQLPQYVNGSTTTWGASETGGLTVNTNESLGQKWFGLDSYTGAIVGNQATGESYTLLGMKARAKYDDTSALVGVDIQDGVVSYEHGTTDSGISSTSPNGCVMLAFKIDSKLDMYGHKATVWYDNRTSGGDVQFSDGTTGSVDVPSAYGTAYAVIDEASKVATVWANHLKTNGSVDGVTSIYSAAVNKGFSKSSAPKVESKVFDQFSAIASDPSDPDTSVATKSKVGMYRLISNSDSNTVDVVISLNQEVARITQRNSSVKNGEYIYLGNGSSQFGDVLNSGNKGLIKDSRLAPGSDKTLGDVVTVNEITSTAYGPATCNAYGTTDGDTPYKNNGTAVTSDSARTMLYETSKLESAFTGTISTYKQGGEITGNPALSANLAADPEYMITSVTLTSGKSYNLSGITGSDVPGGTDSGITHLVDKALTPLTSENTSGGVTYTFYLDEVGRFLGVGIPNEYKFLYTTFADYEVGAVGTGTIDYYVYGVDWNGNIVKTDNKLSSITLPVDVGDMFADGLADADGNSISISELRCEGDYGYTLPYGYNQLPVTKKDFGTGNGVALGNRIAEGRNTRFMMDGKGNLTWYREGKDYGGRFLGWYTGTGPSNIWTIRSSDAKNGFVRVKNQPSDIVPSYEYGGAASISTNPDDNVDYLLTNDTKFIVVTGSGTADLKVNVYNGLTELLDGATTVEIYSCFGSESGDDVYYLTGETQYGNVDVTKNNTITTVIMSDSNLFRYSTDNLYFAAPGAAATGVKLAGNTTGHTINQYKLYNNGKAAYYWVDENVGASAFGTGDTGDFYTLAKINTISDQPIYKAVRVTNNGTSNAVNRQYRYITVNDVQTAEIGGKVYKVGDAIVAPAYGENVKGGTGTNSSTFVATNDIDSVLKLNNAISMGTASDSGDLYDITVAIVYSGVNVSCIYVTDVQPHT